MGWNGEGCVSRRGVVIEGQGVVIEGVWLGGVVVEGVWLYKGRGYRSSYISYSYFNTNCTFCVVSLL